LQFFFFKNNILNKNSQTFLLFAKFFTISQYFPGSFKFPADSRSLDILLGKGAEIIHKFFPDFLGDVLGFRIDLERFAALVRQHALHHSLLWLI